MDEQPRSRPDEPTPGDPAEGVRIIGADEAAEAIERGEVAPRRSDDELRYGDRPPEPAGPRPALRFPLDASADPSRIERPPVEPPPDPVTGPVSLPHWTDPPTGEVPAVLINDDAPLIEDDDDLEAWSSFATAAPRWRDADDDWGDDDFVEQLRADSGEVRMGALGDRDAEPSHEEYFGFEDMAERVEERTGDATAAAPVPGAAWAQDDADWSASDAPLVGDADGAYDDGEYEDEGVDAVGYADGGYEDDRYAADAAYDDDAYDDGAYDEAYDDGRYAPAPGGGGGGRDMPTAIGVGLGIAVVAIVSLLVSTAATTVLVAAILLLCSAEYFRVLRSVGWEAATLVGEVACVAMPLAVYWKGPVAIPIVGTLVVITTLCWYLAGAGGPDPRVLEGTGATFLGVAWIGGLGSAATAMLSMPDGRALLVTAILAAVAHDVVGLFSGRSMGHRPLSAASPNKTVEGTAFGMAAALVVTVIWVGVLGNGPWSGVGAALVLGIGAAIAAPLGDLCQSLVKRDLGVKDMGTVLPGHGGVLDRFDAMLFVLPTVYWLAVTLGDVGF